MAKRNHEPDLFAAAAVVMPEGYYSGDQPNPHLRAFVEAHLRERPYDPITDDYNVSAFSVPLDSTKATALYNMHVYWSKKPHDAIQKYISHYTQPGDLVLDPFCGSGGTALAALLEGRKAIAIDRSPAATFITKNYCTPVEPEELIAALQRLQDKVANEIHWLYQTVCDRCDGPAMTGYTVCSQVYKCSRCLNTTPLADCVEIDGQTGSGKAKKVMVCPCCYPKHVEAMDIETADRFGSVPVLVTYHCEGNCRPRRGERRHNDKDPRKRSFFKKHDLGKLKEIERRAIPHWFPNARMMNAPVDQERWGLLWRPYLTGIAEVKDLFTKRNLWALAAIKAAIPEVASGTLRDTLFFGLMGIVLNSSKMYQEREGGISIAKGSY